MAHTLKRTTFVIVLLLLFSFISLSYTECNIPSEFWCDNADVAKQCGVFEQCQKWLTSTAGDAPVVQVEVLYEFLCGDCRKFMAEQLVPAYEKIPGIMNITLLPFGNTLEVKVTGGWVYSCQHGEPECIGDQIETCTINLVKNFTVYFPFIVCLEGSDLDPLQAAKFCAKKHPVPVDDIIACSQSPKGNQMEHEMGMRTPTHKYVPWVAINGIHTEKMEKKAEKDLIALVCKTYTGSPKPAACTKE